MDLAALQERAAAGSPMASSAVPILQGRKLYVDGDALAYYCAGNDDTLLSEARVRVKEKLDEMLRASGAESCTILLTGSGHKGHRFAVARVKPYQGNRTNAKRPKNWRGLRDMLEDGTFGFFMIDGDREADDRFGQFGHADPENTVIATQDKDMRMVPGYHINWQDNRMFYIPAGTFDVVYNDKQFGEKWFWLQMLHGDTADSIPGLPRVLLDGKLKQVGEVTAGKMLQFATTSEEAARCVAQAYHSFYKERWLVEMLEQAVLLWMRRCPDAKWDDCIEAGPMGMFFKQWAQDYESTTICADAVAEIHQRIQQAIDLNALSPQDD